MSNIYIQEPPTHGKVLLVTSVGDIDIELWSKETPKACRNFCQLCMEGYYEDTTFHRVVKGFIAQGGDPTGTGTGGESIYGKPFKDEIHQRLRFVRRGLVAMANAGRDDNGSQFFFTFDAAPELQGKHTIFGKVTGDTVYNMLKLEGTLVDHDDKPVYPQKIIKTKILSNPFDDIVPREKKKSMKKESSKESKKKGTKNFSLLSFGEEAEDDEEEVNAVTSGLRDKSKSSHDLIDDPSLSSIPAVEIDVKKRPRESDEEDDDNTEDAERQERMALIRKRLSKEKPDMAKLDTVEAENADFSERKVKRLKERDEIRVEVNKLMKQMKKSSKNETKSDKSKESDSEPEPEEEENEIIRSFKEQKSKFKNIKKSQLKKGTDRESMTLQILSKFQNKIQNVQDAKEAPKKEVSEEESNINSDAWFNGELKFEEEGPVLAKDANLKDAESFEIFDPRNPINERRRQKGKKSKK